ncbi:MAG TPA: DUF748 domain-containing protein [Methylomirabilota bacterium]|nr:DUF748 domain-containing protein [Methylomirabilota bacterium]
MFRVTGRERKILVGVLLAVVVLGGLFLAVLPEVVRRVAIAQVPKLTGRILQLDDVDLNLFTGHLALKGVRVQKQGGNERAYEIERIDVRLDYLPFLFHHLRLTEITAVAPNIQVLRRGPAEFDFSDVLDRFKGGGEKSKEPSKWKVTLERVTVQRLTGVGRDQTTSPESVWRIDDLNLAANGLTFGPSAKPGRLQLDFKLNDAPITVVSDSLVLVPLAAKARATVEGFDVTPVQGYLPPSVPAAPRAGRVNLALAAAIELGEGALKSGTVQGKVTTAGVEVFQTGRTEPFLKVARLDLEIKEADLAARSLTIGSLAIDGLAGRAVRDAQERIDLVALAGPPKEKGTAPAPGASSPPPAGADRTAAAAQPAEAESPKSAGGDSARPDFKVKVEQITLRKGELAFRDEAVKPLTTLTVSDLSADVKDITWPVAGPATFAVSMKMPKSGTVDLKGSVTPVPFDIDFESTLRNGTVEPFQPYLPVMARFVGSFNADGRNHVTIDKGQLTATSRGRNWIEKFALYAPGETTPTARFDRFALDGIDFSWPKYAKVSKISLIKPDVRVERDPDGVISLRKLFTPDTARGQAPKADEAKADASKADAGKPEPAKKDSSAGGLPIPVEIGMIIIQDGRTQFIDRTTSPPFAETISRFGLTIEGLSSTPGRRARIATQAVIGGSSAFDLKGEIAPFGEVYADLAGELRDFKLTSVNPYSDPLIAWAMKTGQLGVKVHYRIEKNQLTADNEIIVRNLTVAPTRQNDEVKKKIGLPLGMIVALITDKDNGIDVKVPLSGELSQVKAGMGDAIWTAVKNALTNIVAAPFRSIGKLFKGKDGSLEDLRVDPVTFAAGSADVDPEMSKHLGEVAGFLKQAPMIKLALAPVAAPRDVESLKAQELTLRIQRLQNDKKLPNFKAAVAAAFKETLPDVKPPESSEAQLAALREREPAPDGLMTELLERRVETIRDALVKTEGIAAERLLPGTAQPSSGDEPTEGRIEFQIEQ